MPQGMLTNRLVNSPRGELIAHMTGPPLAAYRDSARSEAARVWHPAQ